MANFYRHLSQNHFEKEVVLWFVRCTYGSKIQSAVQYSASLETLAD